MQQPASQDEYSLYFHIPFCEKKCPYCHFFVLPNKENYHHSLLDGLKKEWEQKRPLTQGKNWQSLYFGGGTPSLWPLSCYACLFDALSPPQDIEITLEANPHNLDKEKLRAFKNLGFNRLSFGVQSLDEGELLTLGRAHNANSALSAIEDAYNVGFDNISIDLLFDVPSQTLTSFERTLNKLQTLPITHLSLYNLTFEPHTSFYKHKETLQKQLPSENISTKMYETACKRLSEIGLEQYEISAFAKAGFVSKHNSGYWRSRPFLGLGPSAFSDWNYLRFQNPCSLSKYLKKLEANQDPKDFEEKLPLESALRERLAVQLRLCAGVDLKSFYQTHNAPKTFISQIEKDIEPLISKGLLTASPTLQLTEKGRLFYNQVAIALI